MPGLIIYGKAFLLVTPGGKPINVINWHDDPRLRPSALNLRPRVDGDGNFIHPKAGILHTESGDDPHNVVSGYGPSDPDHGAKMVDIDETDARAHRAHSQHAIIGVDGTVFQMADLATELTWQDVGENTQTFGIEINDPMVNGVRTLYKAVLDEVLVPLCDCASKVMEIPRMIQATYVGAIPRLANGLVRGFHAHADKETDRGPGDCSQAPRTALLDAGYDAVDYLKETDKALWMSHQSWLIQQGAELDVDGDPGPLTFVAARAYLTLPAQRTTGQWVTRPGDTGS